MIITQLNGGLGNQMFQYAIARSLAVKNKSELKLDIDVFKTYALREYELKKFNIEGNFLTENWAKCIRNSGEKDLINRLKNNIREKIFKLPSVTIVQEKYFQFDQQILKLQGNLYLQGYWQSEKYFKDIEDIIRNDFLLKNRLTLQSQIVEEQIKREACSVSIHIRRGDYVSDAKTNQTHGICSLDYYKKCVKILEDKYKKISLFIFSDEPVWVQQNLEFKHPSVFVTHNGKKRAYEDMHLMSLCHHHIIANSSFSWWGAWLNTSKEKMIFAPQKWFRDETKDTKDLIPESWIRI